MSTNGHLAAAELTTVQGTIQLRTDTAAAWNAMKAAAARDGVTLTIAPPAGGYRSWAMQLDMRARPALYNITPGIIPGLPSEHGLGICVDIAQGLAWVKHNGAQFGFTFPLRTDPNHARYNGTTTAGSGGTSIGDDDVIDDAYWKRLDIGLQSVIDQIRGSKEATIKQLREDLSYMRDTTFKSLQDGISHLTANGGDISAADRDLIISAIKAAPAATVAAIKAAL
ncbi:M15 family metallopeptidase domain-containing protein [Parafrigoribacterium humi]|uniref:hypothetical protein n=1 Tax=Parafrigoribacterium humi TaxID=3144664 RepID=UPI0032EEA5B0